MLNNIDLDTIEGLKKYFKISNVFDEDEKETKAIFNKAVTLTKKYYKKELISNINDAIILLEKELYLSDKYYQSVLYLYKINEYLSIFELKDEFDEDIITFIEVITFYKEESFEEYIKRIVEFEFKNIIFRIIISIELINFRKNKDNFTNIKVLIQYSSNNYLKELLEKELEKGGGNGE